MGFLADVTGAIRDLAIHIGNMDTATGLMIVIGVCAVAAFAIFLLAVTKL